MSMLSEILATKRTEVAVRRKRISPLQMETMLAAAPPIRNFRSALDHAEGLAIIAEVKKASPSKGVIREDFEPVEIARTYAENGASCLSVLTDEQYFQGHLEFLKRIRVAVDIPILRKDFIVDPWQLDESRAAGADAVLLIVAALSPEDLRCNLAKAQEHNLGVLVEVHDQDEMDEALSAGATLIGINNRDLHTFRTNIKTTIDLMRSLPNDSNLRIVSESGILTCADIQVLKDAGVHAALVGEALMRESDIGAKLRQLLGTQA